MTNQNDSFIDEVSDEVRRDRLFALMRRWGWLAVLLVLLLVGGTAWVEWQAARDRAEAEAFGDGVVAALQIEDDDARIAALQDSPAPGAAAALRGLLAATEQEAAGDVAGAAATLDAVATDRDVPAIYRDLAGLKSQMLDVPDRDPATRRAALESLAAPGAPYALLASEQIALMDVAAGDTEAALTRLNAIVQDAGASQGLRDRASALIVALGGTPAQAPAGDAAVPGTETGE